MNDHQLSGARQTANWALIFRARWGDLGAFDQLVARYQDGVWNLTRYFLCDGALAQSVTEDIFLKIHALLKESYWQLMRQNFPIWLYRFTLRAAEEQLKKMRPGELGQASRGLLPLRGPSQINLDQTMGQMAENHREVIILRQVLGLSFDEIAHVLGVSEGTVRSRLHAARLKFRDILKKNGSFNQA